MRLKKTQKHKSVIKADIADWNTFVLFADQLCSNIGLTDLIEMLESELIELTMDRSKTNKEAADRLGLGRTTLLYKLDCRGLLAKKAAANETVADVPSVGTHSEAP